MLCVETLELHRALSESMMGSEASDQCRVDGAHLSDHISSYFDLLVEKLSRLLRRYLEMQCKMVFTQDGLYAPRS